MLHENKGKAIYVNDDLKLEQFDQELDYILSNIKGNSNYGKDFVAEVEKTFELE